MWHQEAVLQAAHSDLVRYGYMHEIPEVFHDPNVRLSQARVPQVTGPMVLVTGYLSSLSYPFGL